MQALVYLGPGNKALQEHAKPAIVAPTETVSSGDGKAVAAVMISFTTRLVDTVSTSVLLNTLRSHKLDPKLLITHCFKLGQTLEAYESFGHAAKSRALKGIIES